MPSSQPPEPNPSASLASHPAGDVSNVRWYVVLVVTLTSILLYLDRVCLAGVVKSIKTDLDLTDMQKDWVLGAFFWAYALAQMPAGWLADRFGARTLLTLFVVIWSIFTFAIGFAGSFLSLMLLRMVVGIAQAGAYPASGGLLSRWVEFPRRAMASSIVTVGGRIGGAIAPALAVAMAAALGTWRQSFEVFGLVGIAVGAAFWYVFRDYPREHPWCSPGEIERIEGHAGPAPRPTAAERRRAAGVPIVELLRSSDMWFMCAGQFLINVGWAFLVTKLPEYLETTFKMSKEQAAGLAAVPMGMGIVGMLLGGPLTDVATKLWGKRWGRAWPMIASRLAAALAFVVCTLVDHPYAKVACFAMVAFSTDFGVPAIWAYMQDVGGRTVGSVLGWGNMFGNFGAAVAPLLIGWILAEWDENNDWSEAFLVCAASFVLSAVVTFGVNAEKLIAPSHDTPRAGS